MSKEKNERNEKKEEAKRAQLENDEKRDDKVKELGQLTLDENEQNHKIYLLSIIGEIEGHDVLSNNSKTTKYEHVLP